MKRIFTLLFFVVMWCNAYTQDAGSYQLQTIFVLHGPDHDSKCSNRFDIRFAFNGSTDLNKEEQVVTQNLTPVGSTPTTFTNTIDLPNDKKLTRIHVFAERQWLPKIGGCTGEKKDSYAYPDFSSGCWSYDVDEAGRFFEVAWSGTASFRIFPKNMNLFYFNRKGQQETDPSRLYLPSSHAITIKATTGYPASVYGWQYRIGSVGGYSWMPSNLYSGSVATFSGNELDPGMLTAIKNNVPVYIKIVTGCTESQEMILQPMLSAPNFTSVTGIAPTCSYLSDGKIKVTVSRVLEEGETMSFTLDGVRYPKENLTRDDFDADLSYTLTGYPAFSNRTLSFVGFYGRNTYTDDPNLQNSIVTIPERAPIAYAATPQAVHCFDGADGKISITAQGGNQQYTAFLSQNGNDLAQQTFAESGNAVFTDLVTGAYSIRLLDSQGCESRDGNGNAITYGPVVMQPLQRLLVTQVDNVEPLAFGGTDGHVTARAESGTNPYTFEWTDRTTGNILTADASQTEDASMTSRLSNLAKGWYRVTARDAQYALASPATEQNISGCYDTLSFTVTEPPLLTVYIDEQHFVSCYGYSDGDMMAHGAGGRPYLPESGNDLYQYAWYVVDNGNAVAFNASDENAFSRPSTWYRVSVTDRNNITAWSDDFHLVQPDPLKIAFNTSQLLCNGDTDGTSEAIAKGGTIPYRYTWSTEETTAAIAHLTDGWYSVVVTDTRGCTTYDQTEVTVPDGLEVEASLTPPVCNGYANGSITLAVTGGKPAYTYVWSTGAAEASVDALSQGQYSVTITDGNGCFIVRDYTLQDPSLLAVDLGPDRQLCKDQVLELNPAIADPLARYVWTKDGAPFASTSNVTLADAGRYTLAITDGKDCHNEGDITITRTDTEIAASIVVATRVPVGETFRVTNISYPEPERVQWLLPPQAREIGHADDYIELVLPAKGEYTIGLKSFVGQCEAVTYEPVRTVSASELTDYQMPVEPYIKQFMVTPNPNTGRFTATVELREAGDFTLALYSGQGVVVSQKAIKNQSVSSIDFELSVGASKGIYMLQLITAQGYSTFKVIVD